MSIAGQRTLIESLRETAELKPEATAIHQIMLNGGSDGEVSFLLTYRDLVKRVDELTWWLKEKVVAQNGEISTTIGYLAPNDLRTLLLPLAAAECNLVVLLLSPRNSFEAQAHLVAANQCSALIVDKAFAKVAASIDNVQHVDAPDLWHILAKRETDVKRFSKPTSWQDARDAGIVKLHTSGSTGLPKSVHISHAVLATVDIQRTITDSDGQPCQLAIFAKAKRAYTAFPFFHVAGFHLACFLLFSGNEMVLGPPHQPTSLEMVRRVLKVAQPEGLLLPPSILDDIVLDAILLEDVCRSKLVFYGGGQVSEHTGNVLSKRVCLFNGIGSTECGSICLMPLAPQDWRYHHFTPENGITWHPIGSASEEYELVITKKSQYNPYQAVFHSFPELSEWRSKDIFAKHPTTEGLWEYRGRLDDLIVLSTGEKLNPLLIESVILSSLPHIKSALVVGSRRPRPALLVETIDTLRDTTFDADELRSAIVQCLSTGDLFTVSRDGQISPEDIIISSVDKPFHRTWKGSINRKLTQELYSTEIDAVYSNPPARRLSGSEWILDCSTAQALTSSLLKQFQELLHASQLGLEDNLFYVGLDSRQAQIAALCIRRALGSCLCNNDFKVESIYTHPTVSLLSQRILSSRSSPSITVDSEVPQYQRVLEASLKYHREQIQSVSTRVLKTPQGNSPRGQHILLTGSTGFVGSYLLQALRARSEITSITCLDRSNSTRISHASQSRFNTSTDDGPVIRKYTASLSESSLGLSVEDYEGLLASVNCVIHCQWPVDFNQSLAYFQPNINGVSNLARFCMETAAEKCPLIFLSSIATIQRCPITPVPELHLSNPEYCQTGYGESKLIASEILNPSIGDINLTTTICRVGQVCGPFSMPQEDSRLPQWPSRDWFPTLLRCSKYMGYLPDTLGKASRIDWIPVDVLADILADNVVQQSQDYVSSSDVGGTGATYHHLINPTTCDYVDLVPILQRKLCQGDQNSSCQVMSLQQWTKEMERRCLDGQDLPGAELLEFFQDLSKTSKHDSLVLDTKNTVAALPRLGMLASVDEHSVERWLEAWKI